MARFRMRRTRWGSGFRMARRTKVRGGFRRKFRRSKKLNPFNPRGCSSQNISRFGGIGLPKQMRVNLVFEESWPDTTAIPGFAHYIFKGNALYDPDPTLGGNSASGARMWSYLYKRYRVTSSQAYFEVINNDIDTGVRIALWPSANGAAPAVLQKNGISGLPGCKSAVVVNQTGKSAVSNFAKTRHVMGCRDDSDIGFTAALCTADPTHLWYWDVAVWSDAGVALTAECRIRICYQVTLSEPNFAYMADVGAA